MAISKSSKSFMMRHGLHSKGPLVDSVPTMRIDIPLRVTNVATADNSLPEADSSDRVKTEVLFPSNI